MEDIFKEIFKKRDGKSKLSLDRIKILLDRLGNPQDKLKFIHIAGTNGKGSITTMLSNVLKNSEYKVGKCISPYVDNFFERIQINNEYITENEVKDILNKIIPIVNEMDDAPTSFEIITAIAFEYFYENKCDIVCLEVGMGGRFDSTNAISTNLISIISIIDYDHMDYLGNTLEEIAFEKCGIIKENKVTISYPLQDRRAKKMIEAISEIRGNKLVKINVEDIQNVKKIDFHYLFSYKGNEYELGLNGKHQIYNSLIVIEAVNELNNLGYNISYEKLYEGLKYTKFVGRLDVVKKEPYVIFDGAHNPSGAKALKQFIIENNENRKVTLIVGRIQGKNHENFFEELKGVADRIIITKIEDKIKKSDDLDMLYNIASKYNENVIIEENKTKAYEMALRDANKNDMIIITGSLYLVSECYMIKNN